MSIPDCHTNIDYYFTQGFPMISHSLGHGSNMRQNKKCLTRNISKKDNFWDEMIIYGELDTADIGLFRACRGREGVTPIFPGRGQELKWATYFLIERSVICEVTLLFLIDFTDFSPISSVFVRFSIFWLVLPISNNFSTSFHAYNKGLFKCCVVCSIFNVFNVTRIIGLYGVLLY